MNVKLKLITLVMSGAFLGGCANLGQPDFTCASMKKDGVCAGPKDIYELTNHRESLENLTLEELEQQLNGDHTGQGRFHFGVNTKPSKEGKEDVVVYKKRTLEQHTPYNYQTPEVIPQTRFPTSPESSFGAWPNNGEPMAPEALAMMSEPKPMRILINSYKTESGALNMPGYVFVDTNPQTFEIGRDASLRPSRIVPLELSRESNQNLDRMNQRAQGVDGLGVEAPINGGR
jgi:conjugal transfer pilus assembly protein TraV